MCCSNVPLLSHEEKSVGHDILTLHKYKKYYFLYVGFQCTIIKNNNCGLGLHLCITFMICMTIGINLSGITIALKYIFIEF
jgi:hypothetical protein